jgi:hypothetical protein
MELSIKSPAVQAAAAVGGFMAFLAEVGAERDKGQQTKTRWALDYYIGKLAHAHSAKAGTPQVRKAAPAKLAKSEAANGKAANGKARKRK